MKNIKHYPEKRFFNLDSYTKLAAEIGKAIKAGKPDAEFDEETFETAFNSFYDFIRICDSSSTHSEFAKSKLEGYELSESIRRYEHLVQAYRDTARAHVNLVNNLARFYGTDRIFEGTKDSYMSEESLDREVEDFCIEVTCEIYSKRIAA